VIVILADDLGFSDLGSYGGEIDTPHLGRLAGGGLRFTQGYNTYRCWPSRAAGPDPVGGLMSGAHVADAGDAAVGVANHGEPLECEWRPGAISQEMIETLEIARHVAVEERDADARIDGNPLFSQVGMSVAACASRNPCRLNQPITRRRTRSVSVARSSWVSGLAGWNAGGPSGPCGPGSLGLANWLEASVPK